MGEQFEVLNAVLQIVLPGQAVMGLSGNNLPEVLAFQQKI
jgi:4-hydroxy-tetrahydrodipicolinate synthase